MSETPASQPREDFEDIFACLQSGDTQVQSRVLEEILPNMIAAIQRKFGSSRTVDVDGAVASACRTVLRRQWQFRRTGPEVSEDFEPRDWGELVGLMVRFAYNKARTQLNKRVDHPLPSGENDESDSGWHPVDGSLDALSELLQAEMREQVKQAQDSLVGSLSEMDSLILRGKLDGLTFGSIKDELRRHGMHRTEDAVRKRWSRTIVPLLQRILCEYQDDS